MKPLTAEERKRLYELQKNHPSLTFQNDGYEYLDKTKFTEEEKEAFSEVESILKEVIGGFIEFNNFKLRKSGEVVARFQYNYGHDSGQNYFKGVGYCPIEEL